MAGSLIWSISALRDLTATRKYIAKHTSPEAATRVTEKILTATGRLEHFPESGRVVPELNRSEIREIIISSYRVIYRRSVDATEVLRIAHVRRDLRGKGFRGLRR